MLHMQIFNSYLSQLNFFKLALAWKSAINFVWYALVYFTLTVNEHMGIACWFLFVLKALHISDGLNRWVVEMHSIMYSVECLCFQVSPAHLHPGSFIIFDLSLIV